MQQLDSEHAVDRPTCIQLPSPLDAFRREGHRGERRGAAD